MTNMVSRLLREPLLQFLVIGGAIYGAYALFAAPEENYRDNVIRVDSNRIDGLISEWEARWNRPPTRAEIDGLIQAYVKEDVLYRQAVAMGLNEDDPITRRRMAQKLEFLTSDLARLQEPAEAELERFFEENRASYREPDRISFIQLFFDPDKRGQATAADAEHLLEQLIARGEPTEDMLELGDRFMLQNYFSGATQFDISRQLGSEFAEAVMQLEPGRWQGPVRSGYGLHLVYVLDLLRAPPAKFDDAKVRVLEDWHMKQREAFNEEFLAGLKERYEIIIEELPSERLLDAETATGRPDDRTPTARETPEDS